MSQPYARAKVGAVGASASTVDLSGKAKEITLSSTTDCWINFNGTAVANECFYLPADNPVTIDLSMKDEISVIQDSASGYLSVLESASVMLITIVKDFFTGDASLLLVEPTTYTGNSNILRTVAATYTGDASIATRFALTLSGDANLSTQYIVTATGDSNLLDTVQAEFDSGATLIS